MEELVAHHHAAQRLIAHQTIGELSYYWDILDFHDLDRTTAPWLKVVRPVIEKGYLVSQYTASEFVKDWRRHLNPAADPLELDVPNPLGAFGFIQPAPREAQVKIMVSMKVTGPVWLKRNSFEGMTADDIADVRARGFSKVAGSATRLVLSGGRGLVRMAVDIDPLAKGVRSIVSEGSDCKSCQRKASMVFPKSSPQAMDAITQCHDFDTCSAAIVY